MKKFIFTLLFAITLSTNANSAFNAKDMYEMCNGDTEFAFSDGRIVCLSYIMGVTELYLANAYVNEEIDIEQNYCNSKNRSHIEDIIDTFKIKYRNSQDKGIALIIVLEAIKEVCITK